MEFAQTALRCIAVRERSERSRDSASEVRTAGNRSEIHEAAGRKLCLSDFKIQRGWLLFLIPVVHLARRGRGGGLRGRRGLHRGCCEGRSACRGRSAGCYLSFHIRQSLL